MSTVYLIRHGQAGTRDNYDHLSDLGRRQAEMLGQHFRRAGVHFDAAFAGGLERQQETARLALGALPDAPELRIDPRWTEFDLNGLWQTMAPHLIAERPRFAADYERLHKNNAGIDRKMTPCDFELIRTWVGGYPCDGGMETWREFRGRVEEPFAELASRNGSGGAVAVFTSATPTSIWVGKALGLDAERILRVVMVLMNTSFSCFRLRGEELLLLSMNNVPHLVEPELRTVR